MLQDVNEVECWISGGVVAKQWKRWVSSPGRTTRRYGRYGKGTSTAMSLSMHRSVRRAGIGRLFPTSYPQRIDPVTADWMTL